ncbi:hypothetical protein [Nonomuraea insulae]|uniref:SagB-type dehydrogenase family enzyme n=1 Tax=Nonomuraea insulae TaxID=1616787 RepID=A0ABW1CPC7_9ACTN
MIAEERGVATRRYLQAIDRREPVPVESATAPPRYKRYPGTSRTVLDDCWTGHVLRGLIGLTRIAWIRPNDEAGFPRPGRASVVIGRPGPSGGALYPIEAYTVGGSALCHYDVVHHMLETVREGDHRPFLTGLLTGPPAWSHDTVVGPGVVELMVVLTAVFWRNGVKYGDFAYRLQCQEIGVLAAQALALAEVLGLRAAVHLAFDGDAADRLLGLEPADEGALAVLSFSGRHTTEDPSAPTATSATHPPPITGRPPGVAAATATESRAEPSDVRLPYLAALHAATRRASGAADVPPGDAVPPPPAGPAVALADPKSVRASDGIAHRASPVNGYRADPLADEDLATILALGAPPGQAASTALYVLAVRVPGLPCGSYRYCPERMALIETGGQEAVARVCGGRLAANTRACLRTAAAVIVPVGDPLAGLARCGDLWFRRQQAETGLVVHRAALAASALGLTSRIHSDGANPDTDAALGLAGTPWRSLSFLLIGAPRRSGPVLAPVGPAGW